MSDKPLTPPEPKVFDFDAYPPDTLFHDRRSGTDRRKEFAGMHTAIPLPRPARKTRRRRIDPTTFEKQYTDEELEFMTAMQRFKVQTGKTFPSHGEVLRVAYALGYRKI
ncbi:hypothetical protein BH23PLA1_BH23PLA1_31420 [soil metagenome]